MAFRIVQAEDFVFEFLKKRFMKRGTLWLDPIGSILWYSLREAFGVILDCSQWIPGINSELDFWTDNWLGFRIVDRLGFQRTAWKTHCDKIGELFTNGLWTLPTVIQQDNDLSNLIQQCKFGRWDTFICRNTSDGQPSVKGLYSMLTENRARTSWGEVIWKKHILPSRSFHCWRIMHKRLPVDELYKMQGLSFPSQCQLCLKAEESLVHLYEDCFYVRALMSSLMALFELNAPISSTWETYKIAKSKNMSSQLWALWEVGFFEIMWLVWHARNKVRHGEEILSIPQSTGYIYSAILLAQTHKVGTMFNSVQELLTLRRIGVQGISRKPPITIPVTWCPPQHGFVKINVDGASFGSPGRASAGGVFRLSNATVLTSFSASIPVCSPLEAELQAVLIAMDEVDKLGLRKIWLETDSMLVYNKLIKLSSEVPWSIRQRWESLLQRLGTLEFRISHIYREGNRVADRFAALGFTHDGICWWRTIPPGILDLLVSDALSLTRTRLKL